jgi:voltage-gated potassium channel
MRYLNQPKTALDQERNEVLEQWQDWLKIPMLVLSFAWLGLFIVELVWGLNPLLVTIGITIWIIFIIDFGIEILLAPRKLFYLRHHWLIAFSLMVPALRTFQIIGFLRVLQPLHAVRGLQLLQIMTGTNRGMRLFAASVERRGFSYVVGLTAIVILTGAAGMYAFEHKLPGSAITDYGTALWWTAMVMTTIGSDYFPKTEEGRVLCFLLALYAVAIGGYVTAMLATFFVSQDTENNVSKLADSKSIQTLQAEITALKAEIKALVRQNLAP